MPWHTIILRPGVNTQATPTLNTVQWAVSNLIRFKDGLAQSLGGWQALNTGQPFVGTARGMHGWASLVGAPYIAIGTEQRLQIFDSGTVEDITPYRMTTSATANFSTSIGSSVVKVTISGNGVESGDWVQIFIMASVGGLILFGFYQVQTVIDGSNFTITAVGTATANVSNGGALPDFATTNTQSVVRVAFSNHGYSSGQIFPVQVTTTVGGITIAAQGYSVGTVIDANNFDITPGGTATSTANKFENNANEIYNFLIPTGFASNTAVSGYGIGLFGAGPYGIAGSSSEIFPLRQWFLDNWGQDLIGNYTAGPIYFWTPPFEPNTPAVLLPINSTTGTFQSPIIVNTSFVAMPEQIMVALGCDPYPEGSAQDPNLIRWSDVGDFTDWNATAINQAGSFRLPSGSRIVGGLQGPQFGCIWTDIDFWQMQYISPPLVFGFIKVAGGVELLSGHGAGIYQSIVYWVSRNNFLQFDGTSVQVIPCSVWDVFWTNLDTAQLDKVLCATNSIFNEIWWFYPSATGTGEVDSYVKYQIIDQVWDYGSLIRTAWIDVNPYGPPVGADTAGLLQQHEVGNTANGTPLVSSLSSGAFIPGDQGEGFAVIERFVPDFKTSGGNGSVTVTGSAQNYPDDPIVSTAPQIASNGQSYQIWRTRGRAHFLGITGNQLGVFWRIGAARYVAKPAGKR